MKYTYSGVNIAVFSFFAVVLAFLLILSPAAAEKPTVLYVDGVNIMSSGNAGAVAGVSYDKETGTLTLDNATVTKGYAFSGYSVGICTDGDLKVILKGNNTIDMSNDTNGALGVTMGNLSIEGDGSLKGTSFLGFDSEKNLNVKDCSLSVNTTSFSYYSTDNMTFSNCSVTGKATGHWCVVVLGGDFRADNSTVTVSGIDGIICNHGNMTFSESNVAASGSEDGLGAYGYVTVESGNISATGGEAAIFAGETNTNYPDDYDPGRSMLNPFEIINQTKPETSPSPGIILSDKVDLKSPENASIVCGDWTYEERLYGYVAITSISTGEISFDEDGILQGAAKTVLIVPYVEPTPEPESPVSESPSSEGSEGSGSKSIPFPGFALILAGAAAACFAGSLRKKE